MVWAVRRGKAPDQPRLVQAAFEIASASQLPGEIVRRVRIKRGIVIGVGLVATVALAVEGNGVFAVIAGAAAAVNIFQFLILPGLWPGFPRRSAAACRARLAG